MLPYENIVTKKNLMNKNVKIKTDNAVLKKPKHELLKYVTLTCTEDKISYPLSLQLL